MTIAKQIHDLDLDNGALVIMYYTTITLNELEGLLDARHYMIYTHHPGPFAVSYRLDDFVVIDSTDEIPLDWCSESYISEEEMIKRVKEFASKKEYYSFYYEDSERNLTEIEWEDEE